MFNRMCWRGVLLGCFAAIAPQIAGTQSKGIDVAQAKQYFDEANGICEKDAGKLWGKSLCAPMIFANPQTRGVVANQADAESRLKEQDGVFVGELPPEVSPANTAMTWAGTKWTMIMWPLPASPTTRARLVMHELFHHLQDDLGLPGSNPTNAHLATLEGRIWLELEWRALQQALARSEQRPLERKRAVEDALLFRLQRRSLFPKAAVEERELEMNEGLAEYTGYKLRGTVDAATTEAVINRLGSAANDSSFSRSFAYVSGPAYGMLLDLASASWRNGLTAKADLGELSKQAYAISLRQDIVAAANARAAEYDGAALRWSETRQDEERQAALAAYKRRLIDGPCAEVSSHGKIRSQVRSQSGYSTRREHYYLSHVARDRHLGRARSERWSVNETRPRKICRSCCGSAERCGRQVGRSRRAGVETHSFKRLAVSGKRTKGRSRRY
jgi:hypothetical protein